MWIVLFNPIYTLNSGGHAPTYRERKPKGWTQMYHSNYLAAESRSYLLWDNRVLDLPLASSGNSIKGTIKVSYTNLASAKLIVTISITLSPGWPSLQFNGGANLIPLPMGETISFEADVTNVLLQGSNLLLFKVDKVPLVGWGTATISATLEILAESSDVEPPPFWETWPSWWPYAAAGAGMAVIGGLIITSKRK